MQRTLFRRFKGRLSSVLEIRSKITINKIILYSEIPFPLRYLQACSKYDLKNTKEALALLYGIQRDIEKQLFNNNKQNTDIFNTKAEDDFGVFEKKNEGDPFSMKNEQDLKEEVDKVLRKETNEIYGLFP